jgi:hypothetical protein
VNVDPISSGSPAQASDPAPMQPVPPAPPVAPAFGFRLLRNLRAGLRVALFRRVESTDWAASAGQFLALVLAGLVVQLLGDIAVEGSDGAFNFLALPRAMWYVPLILLAGYLISLREAAPRLLLLIAIMFAAASLPYDLAFEALDAADAWSWFAGDPGDGGWTTWVWYGLYALWVGALVKGVLRLTTPTVLRGVGHAATLLAVVIVPLWSMPPEALWQAPSDEPQSDERDWRALGREETFYAQPALLTRELQSLRPQRPGVEDLYFVGVAGFGAEDVFMRELRVISQLFRDRFDADGRSVMLVNNPATVRELPIATATALDHALQQVGRTIDPEEDVLFLYVTSHGSQDHHLTMQFWPLELADLSPIMVKRMLDRAGIKWRVIAISACYSGGFIEPLKDEHTLIVTAADAENTSFGCSNESDFTYFGRAYFDHALRTTWSFTDAFDQARREIGEREKAEALTSSNPQIYVGAQIEQKLARMSERLRAGGGLIQVQAPASGAQPAAPIRTCVERCD